jgi:hypothetical protein
VIIKAPCRLVCWGGNGIHRIRGARENNLKDVSLRIPKRKVAIRGGEAAWT